MMRSVSSPWEYSAALIHNGERIFRARFPVLARVHILDAVQNIRVRRIINAFVGNEAHEFAAEFHPQCKK